MGNLQDDGWNPHGVGSARAMSPGLLEARRSLRELAALSILGFSSLISKRLPPITLPVREPSPLPVRPSVSDTLLYLCISLQGVLGLPATTVTVTTCPRFPELLSHSRPGSGRRCHQPPSSSFTCFFLLSPRASVLTPGSSRFQGTHFLPPCLP